MLETKDCHCVHSLIKNAAPLGNGYANAVLTYPHLPTYIKIFTCCSEKHISKNRSVLKSMNEIKSACYPVHGVFVEYHSQLDCVIQIEGESKTGQLYFQDSQGNPAQYFYCEGYFPDILGSSDDQPRCGEIYAAFHKTMSLRGGDEAIHADVFITPAVHYGGSNRGKQTKYKIKVCP